MEVLQFIFRWLWAFALGGFLLWFYGMVWAEAIKDIVRYKDKSTFYVVFFGHVAILLFTSLIYFLVTV